MTDNKLPTTKWEAAIPDRLRETPYDEEFAFISARMEIDAAVVHLVRAGEYFAWIQANTPTDKFLSTILKYGFNRELVGLTFMALNHNHNIIGTDERKIKPSKEKSSLISIPQSEQIDLLVGTYPVDETDLDTRSQLADHVRRLKREKKRLEDNLTCEQSNRQHTEQLLKERLDREKEWTPSNENERKYKSTIGTISKSALLLRQKLESIRLEKPSRDQVNFTIEELEMIDAQIRAGVAYVKVQLHLENIDDLAAYQRDADFRNIDEGESKNNLNKGDSND